MKEYWNKFKQAGRKKQMLIIFVVVIFIISAVRFLN